MSFLKGYAATGLDILKTKPVLAVRSGPIPLGFLMGVFVLMAALSTLTGSPEFPIPPRKPAALSAESASLNVPTLRISERQMRLYREIFRLQAAGEMAKADERILELKDRDLLGHVLAQRYLHPAYKSGFDELKNWLSAYADHPQAARIAALARARAPKGQGELTPVVYRAPAIEEMQDRYMAAHSYEPQFKRTPAQNARATDMISAIRRHVARSQPSAALRLFNENDVSGLMDDVEKDRMRALIASGYLYAGKTEEARQLAVRALAQSGDKAPMAGWVAGLVFWKDKNYKESAKAFASAARSPYATGWMVSAASYWAGRAANEAGHRREARGHYERAAGYEQTFYGLLATAALGRSIAPAWEEPYLSRRQERLILSMPAGIRAEKLIAAEEFTLAESELRSLYLKGDHDRKKALLAYAYDRGLPHLSMKLAHAVTDGEGETYRAALYPEMPWTPENGYRIDRALLHAIARQESRFNPAAQNRGSGATGLMQLMPSTATHVTKDRAFREGRGEGQLKTAQTSLEIGQRYIEELLNNPLVGQDLLSLAVAYNAGPGKLAKWKAERPDIDDPLLFIETIPYTETRAYVERVLSNYWIYRARFDQPNESLYALAKGQWARYAAHDKGALRFADAR